ncbi:MAG: DUF2723 domain-containing protein [Candidatus Edwardsbacteria bacterium]|nr:DUF2723 domain-containing protein [Candidatus Edwardsbacteria bacterium]
MHKETWTRLLVGAGVFLAALAVYVRTMAATTSFWDCGEFITASYILGIPHPPGYPIYAVIGRTLTLLLPMFKEVAFRVNLLSPLFSALTISLVYLLIAKIIVMWRGEPKDALEEVILHLAAVAGAVFLAFTPTWWDNSIEAEVYGPAMFTMSLTVWLALRWRDRIGQVGNRKMLLLIVYLLALGMAGHMSTLLAAGPILLFILVVDWRAVADWKLLGISAALVFAALTINAYLLIRANLNPNLDMCSPKDWESLMYVLQRKQYEPFNFFERREPFMYQFGHMCLRYFKWQFWQFKWFPLPLIVGVFGALMHLIEGEEKKFGVTAAVLLVGGVLLALYTDSPIATLLIALGVVAGFFHVVKRRDKSFAIVGPAFIICSLGLVTYLNMANPQPRDRDYIYAPAYEFFAIWIGLGAWRLMMLVKEQLWERSHAYARYAAIGLGAALIGFGLFNVKQYFFEKDRSKNWIPHDYGYNILATAEPNAIVFTNGDNDTYPVWFQQEVKHFRPDVRIVNLSLANVDWYLKQMKRRGVPLEVSDYQLTQLMPVRIADGSVLKNSDLAIRLILAGNAGKKMTLSELLAPADSFARWLFGPGYKERNPVYFAVTVSDDNFVGLQPHLSFEGMLYRVTPELKNKAVDIERTRRNLNDVYRFTGITDSSLYKDDNTQRITLGNYVVAFWQLGMALRQQAAGAGDKDPALRRQLLQEALKQFEMAHKIMPDEPQGIYWVGMVNAELGNYPAALERFHEMARREKNNPYIAAQVGAIFQQAGQFDSAEACYREILIREPGNKVAYERLYDLYLNSEKNPAKAIGVLGEWLRYNPNDANAARMLAGLKKQK